MNKSLKRGVFVHKSIIKHYNRITSSNNPKKVIKTWSRASVILPQFLGFTFQVHNGNKFIPIQVEDERMIGKKLGEFSPTKKSAQHSKELRNKYKKK